MLSKQFSVRSHGSIRKLKAYGTVGVLSFGIALSIGVQDVKADEKTSDLTKIETMHNTTTEIGISSTSTSTTDEAIATKESEIAKAESEIQSLTKKESEQNAEHKIVQEDIQKTNNDISDKEKELDVVKVEVVKQTDATKEQTDKLKKTADEATSEVAKAQTQVNVATKNLADEKSKTELVNVEATKKAQDEVTKAQADVKTADEAVADAKKAVEDASKTNGFPYTTDFESTEEWNKVFSEYAKLKNADNPYNKELEVLNTKISSMAASEYNRRSMELYEKSKVWNAEREAKLKTLLEKVIAVEPEDKLNNKVGDDSAYSNVTYDIHNISQDVLVDLSQYFATLVNNARKDLGIEGTTKVHLDDITFAKEVAAQIERDKYTKSAHYGRAINEAARRRGLLTSANPGVDTTVQYYENLMISVCPEGYGVNLQRITKAELYNFVQNFFQGFMHEGKNTGHYGHATNLMKVTNVGLAFSLTDDTLKMHVISVSPFVYKTKEAKEFYEDNSTELLANKDFSAGTVDIAKVNELKADLAKKEEAAKVTKVALATKEEALKMYRTSKVRLEI